MARKRTLRDRFFDAAIDGAAFILSPPAQLCSRVFNYVSAKRDYEWGNKNPNIRKRSYGWYELQHACYRGETGRANILLKAGADPNIVVEKKHYSDSPLNLAMRRGSSDLVKTLLRHPGIDLEKTVSDRGDTLFKDAQFSLVNSAEKVKLLLEDGRVDPNAGSTAPIVDAVLHSQPEVLRVLLSDPRVDVSVTFGKNKATLLQLARGQASESGKLASLFFGKARTGTEQRSVEETLRVLEKDKRVQQIEAATRMSSAMLDKGQTPTLH